MKNAISSISGGLKYSRKMNFKKVLFDVAEIPLEFYDLLVANDSTSVKALDTIRKAYKHLIKDGELIQNPLTNNCFSWGERIIGAISEININLINHIREVSPTLGKHVGAHSFLVNVILFGVIVALMIYIGLFLLKSVVNSLKKASNQIIEQFFNFDFKDTKSNIISIFKTLLFISFFPFFVIYYIFLTGLHTTLDLFKNPKVLIACGILVVLVGIIIYLYSKDVPVKV